MVVSVSVFWVRLNVVPGTFEIRDDIIPTQSFGVAEPQAGKTRKKSCPFENGNLTVCVREVIQLLLCQELDSISFWFNPCQRRVYIFCQ